MDLTTMIELLGQAFLVSLQIFFGTLLGALPLGLVVAAGRMSRFKPLALLTRAYISVMRGTPLMLQLLTIYFGPYYLFGLNLSPEWKMGATMVAFIINYAAYFAEIYRAGIQSVPRGQWEAAEVLGYGKVKAFMRIIAPQVVKRVLPSLTNEIITLVKDTSLAFVLGVGELMSQAKIISAAQVSMEPFVIAAAIYWVFNLVVEMSLTRIEKALSYYHD